MQLSDIVSAPWAITPDMYDEVQAIYARHMRGEKIDISGIEARIGSPLNNARQPMQVSDEGVAVIPLQGVLAKRANLFMQISGGASTQIIGAQLQQALNDDAVKAIVLQVDSPGGAVDGTQQLADAVYAARGKKPIIAHVDGMCCSAAYWIASAADQVLIDGDTTAVGSIGVICQHVDTSMAAAARGVRVTEIKAGKYKGVGSPNKPLGTDETVIQDQVNHIYDVFVNAVARNRGTDAATVRSQMAEGQIFPGKSAIQAGLVDGVATLAGALTAALDAAGVSASSGGFQASGAGVAPLIADAIQSNHEDNAMDPITVESVKANAPQVVATIRAEAVSDEIARVKAVRAMCRPGCEALIDTLAGDGKTTGPEAAVQVLAHLDTLKAQALLDLKADAAGVSVASAVPPAADKATKAAMIDPRAVGTRAASYRATQKALGIEMSDAEAVDAVLAGKAV